jgi:rubrerythrin
MEYKTMSYNIPDMILECNLSDDDLKGLIDFINSILEERQEQKEIDESKEQKEINESKEEFVCYNCGCYFLIHNRNDFVCPNCEYRALEKLRGKK